MKREGMNISVVLAMHGVPPKEFPRSEMMELLLLHQRLESAGGPERQALEKRHDEIEQKMRSWPRTAENDPFFASSQKMAKALGELLGAEVFIGFNEFCAPSIEEAVAQAASKSPRKVIIITPMMTGGGAHSEKDIPRAVGNAKKKYPHIEIIYAWPYDVSEVAHFLAKQVKHFI